MSDKSSFAIGSQEVLRNGLINLVNIPSRKMFRYWEDNAMILSKNIRDQHLIHAEKTFSDLMKDTSFTEIFNQLSTDQKSLLPILIMAQEDLDILVNEESEV